jgi:hypothetical protein
MILNNKELIEWKENAKADYIKTPISVLRYITELEKGLQDAAEDAKKQFAIHLHEEATLQEEINRLKAKLSEQVDPIELIQYAMTTFMYYRCSDDRAKKILQQFKKERNEKEQ